MRDHICAQDAKKGTEEKKWLWETLNSSDTIFYDQKSKELLVSDL